MEIKFKNKIKKALLSWYSEILNTVVEKESKEKKKKDQNGLLNIQTNKRDER